MPHSEAVKVRANSIFLIYFFFIGLVLSGRKRNLKKVHFFILSPFSYVSEQSINICFETKAFLQNWFIH